MRKLQIVILIVFLTITGLFVWSKLDKKSPTILTDVTGDTTSEEGSAIKPHELTIEFLRNGTYPGSELVIEETLPAPGSYDRYITSYTSEGLKIYALLTVPKGTPPQDGWPVIIFNHGFIPPLEYRTTERYIAYTDAFSRAGYIVLKPDYRGHGSSEGLASGGYGSNGYTIDVLNAVASIKKYPTADENRIGMWGHSMGGFITLRNMVVSKDIKAGVIWGGVVGSYSDLLNNWRRTTGTPTSTPQGATPTGGRRWRIELVERFGTPQTNPTFWDSISATSFLGDISGPIQLHHGTADTSVPVKFSEDLHALLQKTGKQSELFTYPGDDHNISRNLSAALSRSVKFFDTHVKNTTP